MVILLLKDNLVFILQTHNNKTFIKCDEQQMQCRDSKTKLQQIQQHNTVSTVANVVVCRMTKINRIELSMERARE
jgi:hypothetical protein